MNRNKLEEWGRWGRGENKISLLLSFYMVLILKHLNIHLLKI